MTCIWFLIHTELRCTVNHTCDLKLFYLLHSAESFSRANRFSASQATTRIVWNPKVHYRLHRRPPPVPILSQINPVHAPFPLLEDPFTLYPPKWYLSFRYPHQNPVYTYSLPHTSCMPHPSHSSDSFYTSEYFYLLSTGGSQDLCLMESDAVHSGRNLTSVSEAATTSIFMV